MYIKSIIIKNNPIKALILNKKVDEDKKPLKAYLIKLIIL